MLRERHGLSAEASPTTSRMMTSSEIQRMDVRKVRARPVALRAARRRRSRSLVGGAVAAMLMLASVNERVAEIGLRRAVGARPGDIRRAVPAGDGDDDRRSAASPASRSASRLVKSRRAACRSSAPFLLARGALGLAAGRDHGPARRRLPARRAAQLEPGDARCGEAVDGRGPPVYRSTGCYETPPQHRHVAAALFAIGCGPLAVAQRGVGIAAVLVTSAIGKGAEREVRRGIEALGANLVVVRPAQVRRRRRARSRRTCDHADASTTTEAIAALPEVARGAPGMDGARAGQGGRAARCAQRAGHDARVPRRAQPVACGAAASSTRTTTRGAARRRARRARRQTLFPDAEPSARTSACAACRSR